MKKLFATLAIAVIAVISANATDVTEVWSSLKDIPGIISAPIDGSLAEKQGFKTLNVALNASPTDADLAKFAELTATIPASQKLATANAQGFTVSAYATPVDAAGTDYYIMYTITGENNGVKQMMVIYGTMARENMAKAMSNINLEEIIGL